MTDAVSRLDRITADPMVCHGAPTIRGMRLRVQDVSSVLASGMTNHEILADYDELERDDILAAGWSRNRSHSRIGILWWEPNWAGVKSCGAPAPAAR